MASKKDNEINYNNIMNIELSIIVPVYNTARYLTKCITSIHNQTFKNWELILVDDGSTDGSAAICNQWAAKDERIRVLHKCNTGQADSRNVGLELCRGQYIGFVDSDDWIDVDMYEYMMEQIKKTDSDIAVCNHYTESKKKSWCKNPSDEVVVLTHDQVHDLVIKDKVQSYIWQMVFKRECLTMKMPGNKSYEDYGVLPYWFSNVQRVVSIRRPLYHYRLRRSSLVTILSPEKEFDFFRAEKFRHDFYVHTRFGKHSEKQLIVRGVRVAKHISRISKTLSDRKKARDYIYQIRRELRETKGQKMLDLGLKTRFLLFLLMNHSTAFIYYQKMVNRLMAYKQANTSDFFE